MTGGSPLEAVAQAIAKVLWDHDGPYTNRDQTASACDCGWEGSDPTEAWQRHVAALIVSALELREETRTAGYVNTAKYESAYVPVIERRWVSSWTSGSDEHATSNVPDEWQGLPDYVLDDLELGISGSDQ